MDNGGPAFPQGEAVGCVSVTSGGMTLRDWFAGQAMGKITMLGEPDSDKTAWLARTAYQIADAMIAARGYQK